MSVHKLSTRYPHVEKSVDKMWKSYPQVIHRDIHTFSTGAAGVWGVVCNINLFITCDKKKEEGGKISIILS